MAWVTEKTEKICRVCRRPMRWLEMSSSADWFCDYCEGDEDTKEEVTEGTEEIEWGDIQFGGGLEIAPSLDHANKIFGVPRTPNQGVCTHTRLFESGKFTYCHDCARFMGSAPLHIPVRYGKPNRSTCDHTDVYIQDQGRWCRTCGKGLGAAATHTTTSVDVDQDTGEITISTDWLKPDPGAVTKYFIGKVSAEFAAWIALEIPEEE